MIVKQSVLRRASSKFPTIMIHESTGVVRKQPAAWFVIAWRIFSPPANRFPAQFAHMEYIRIGSIWITNSKNMDRRRNHWCRQCSKYIRNKDVRRTNVGKMLDSGFEGHHSYARNCVANGDEAETKNQSIISNQQALLNWAILGQLTSVCNCLGCNMLHFGHFELEIVSVEWQMDTSQKQPTRRIWNRK